MYDINEQIDCVINKLSDYIMGNPTDYVSSDLIKALAQLISARTQITNERRTMKTERIINISELENKIQKSRFDVISVKNALENKKGIVINEDLIKMLDVIIDDLFKCQNFEFVLEERIVKEK